MTELKRIFGIQSLLSKLLIAEQLLPALIDSGAAISVIRSSTFELLREFAPRLKMENPDIRASAVNGSQLNFLGVSRLPCRWFRGSPQFVFRFYIVESLSVPLILGFDLLKDQNCAVDFHMGLLDVGHAVLECISPIMGQHFEDDSKLPITAAVEVQHFTIIPPRSEAFVTCSVPDFDQNVCRSGPQSSFTDDVGLVENCVDSNSKHSFLVAASIVSLTHVPTMVRVLNSLNEEVKLYPKQKIAQISQLPSSFGVCSASFAPSLDKHNLKHAFGNSLQHLSVSQQNEVFNALQQFQSVFAKDKWDLGSCDLHKLKIQLTENARPSRVPYRSMNPSKRKDLKEKIQNLREKDLITPTHSEWAAPTVLVPKRDGSYRLVIDYRKLNSQTVKTSWPLPRISDILYNLEGSCFFSSLDLCSGFHQMEIEEEYQHLTSFITPFGLYQWKRMPMGLCNAPGAFQRLMEIVLSGLTYDIVLVYLDDIIVFGRSFSEHLERLQSVLRRIQDANLKISPSKCNLFQKKLVFLGHVVSADGIHTDPSKVEAVKTYPVPKTVKQIRAFMGLVGFYRKFILGFGQIASPLYQLMNKDSKFRWDEQCQRAFDALKEALVSSPILGFPNETDQFVLVTDASLTGIGAVLSQKQKSGQKVIAYASKSLQKGQRNYSATKRELYAVIFFTTYFREFLLGRKFEIITDHRALVWLYSFKDPDAIIARWLEKLSVFDFDIVHRPGKSITNADSLSRIPMQSVSAIPLQRLENSPNLCLNNEQRKDKTISIVRQWLQDGEKPDRASLFGKTIVLQCYWQQFESLKLFDELLCRQLQDENGRDTVCQICVPVSCVPQILHQTHDTVSSGHFGTWKTLERIRQRFYWPGCKNDVETWVAGCEVCQKRKNPKQKHRQEMQPWIVSDTFYCVSVDILGPLPESIHQDRSYRYILMIGDNYSRWFEAVPMGNITSETVCTNFIDVWVSRFGVPHYLHSDNGSQFTSKLYKDMCERLQIETTYSSPYHPQGNAKTERINRTLEDGLSKYCQDRHETWAIHLQTFMMAYRSAAHESTGQTPFRLFFGKEMRLPVDVFYPTLSQPFVGHRDYIFQRISEAEHIYETVSARNNWEMRRQKSLFDRRKYGPTYKVGDLVLLHTPICLPGQTSKLKSHWKGPFEILREFNQLNFILKNKSDGKQVIAHYDRMKPFKVSQIRVRTTRGGKKKLQANAEPLAVLRTFPPTSLSPPTTSSAHGTIVPPVASTDSSLSTHVVPPLSGTSTNNNTTSALPVPLSLPTSRPVRIASKHARYPGFFRAAFYDTDDE